MCAVVLCGDQVCWAMMYGAVVCGVVFCGVDVGGGVLCRGSGAYCAHVLIGSTPPTTTICRALVSQNSLAQLFCLPPITFYLAIAPCRPFGKRRK